MKHVQIYTDGACKGNPGPGGWGAILKHGNNTKEIYGGVKDTTNNRMEMLAVICALRLLKEPCSVDVWTDSNLVVRGMSEWIVGWKARNWKDVKNTDLWKELDALAEQHKVLWHWVRGHNGHLENERADLLANMGVKTLKDGAKQ
ncbi:ribonuclease HI [Pseudomonas luteola]